MEITEKNWDTLLKRLDRIEQSQNDDRKDIDKISINLATVKEQNDKILAMQNRGQKKIEDAVQGAVGEAIQPLEDTMDAFIDKKFVKVKEDTVEKLTLLQKLKKTVKSWKR